MLCFKATGPAFRFLPALEHGWMWRSPRHLGRGGRAGLAPWHVPRGKFAEALAQAALPAASCSSLSSLVRALFKSWMILKQGCLCDTSELVASRLDASHEQPHYRTYGTCVLEKK